MGGGIFYILASPRMAGLKSQSAQAQPLSGPWPAPPNKGEPSAVSCFHFRFVRMPIPQTITPSCPRSLHSSNHDLFSMNSYSKHTTGRDDEYCEENAAGTTCLRTKGIHAPGDAHLPSTLLHDKLPGHSEAPAPKERNAGQGAFRELGKARLGGGFFACALQGIGRPKNTR